MPDGLQRFHFTLKYRSESNNKVAEAFSKKKKTLLTVIRTQMNDFQRIINLYENYEEFSQQWKLCREGNPVENFNI